METPETISNINDISKINKGFKLKHNCNTYLSSQETAATTIFFKRTLWFLHSPGFVNGKQSGWD